MFSLRMYNKRNNIYIEYKIFIEFNILIKLCMYNTVDIFIRHSLKTEQLPFLKYIYICIY